MIVRLRCNRRASNGLDIFKNKGGTMKRLIVLFVLFLLVPAYADDVLNSSLLNAVSLGDAVRVKELLEQGASPNSKNTATGYSSLMGATIHGDTVILKMLLDAGADINVKTTTGETALLYAVMANNVNAADELIKRGANKNATSGMGISPLSMAKTMSNAQMLVVLQRSPKDSVIIDVNEHAEIGIGEKVTEVRVHYDRFKNALSVSATRYVWLWADKDTLEINCTRSFDLTKRTKPIPASLSFYAYGKKTYYIWNSVDYVIDNGQGRSMRLLGDKTIYDSTLRGYGFNFLEPSSPLYQAIQANSKIEIRVSFRGSISPVITLSDKDMEAFREVLNFDVTTYLHNNPSL